MMIFIAICSSCNTVHEILGFERKTHTAMGSGR